MFGLFRRRFGMTDEQVVEQALKAVPEYAKNHNRDAFDADECVKSTIKAIEPVYRGVRLTGLILSPSQAKELRELKKRVKPELERKAKELACECMKKQKVDSISLTAYEALITSELRARGYMFLFQWQKNKVLVTIKVSDTLACTQEIKYSDIKKGRLPELIADVAEAVDLLSGKDLKVSVWKMSKDWKSSAKWIV